MALLSRDPNNIKVQAEFKDQGDKFVAVKNLKKHESKSTKTDPESNLITIASNFDKMSRHVLIFLHQILAGCCLISLILLPTRDLGDYTPIQLNNTNLTVNILFRGTVVPIDTKNLVTSLPSKTQLFLASFSQTSQVFSWVFNILSTIAMVNAIEVAIKSRLDFLKTSSTRIIHVKVYILKFLLVASSLVSFISTLILIPIETRISDPEGVYGTGQWFFYPLELKSSVFITGNVMASWLVLNICRLVFGLVGWLCLFMTCYMKKAQKQKDRDVNSIKMV